MKQARHHIRYAGTVHDARLGQRHLSIGAEKTKSPSPARRPGSFEDGLDEDILEALAKALLPRPHGAS